MVAGNMFRPYNGSCPYCGGIVNIVEGMVYDYTINRDGIPEFLHSENYRVAAYCMHCKKCLYVAPNSNGGYTVYPDDKFVLAMFQDIYKDNTKRSSALGIKLLESDGNPFVNLSDDDDCPF